MILLLRTNGHAANLSTPFNSIHPNRISGHLLNSRPPLMCKGRAMDMPLRVSPFHCGRRRLRHAIPDRPKPHRSWWRIGR
jgi:hypothetical protein